MADAVAVLDYLHKRGLMCEVCADGIAVGRHNASGRATCEGCKNVNARYEAVTIGRLERCACEALRRWLGAHTNPEQG